MAHSSTGCTTNLPLVDVTGGKAWVVWEFDGRPLTAEHGGPVRLLVPHLYFWKSAKWISRLELTATDRARVLAAERLPRPRRPVARAALPGRPVRGSDDTPGSFDPGGTGATTWTTGRIMTKDLPAPHLVRLRLHVEDRRRHWPGQHYLIRLGRSEQLRVVALARGPEELLLECGVGPEAIRVERFGVTG